MCWYPISLNATYTKAGDYCSPRLVPCGKCIACLQKKRADWTFRIKAALQQATSATFLTLTLQDEFLIKNNGKPTLKKEQLQNYFKRVRHETPDLKYYAIGEYGEENLRPHYHGIVWNSNNNVLHSKWGNDRQTFGRITTTPVTPARIHYVTGYIMKKYGDMDEKTGISINTYPKELLKPFAIMSKGIGKNYAQSNGFYHLDNGTFKTNAFDQKGTLSRYLKMKIFEDYELQRLEISELQAEEIKKMLIEKSVSKSFTARAYFKALHENSQKTKKL